MLKIASSFIKIYRSIVPYYWCCKYGFSSVDKTKITEETFALVLKRLEQKTLEAREIEQKLINSANDESIKVNG